MPPRQTGHPSSINEAKQEAGTIRRSAQEDFAEEKRVHNAEIEKYKELIRKLEGDYYNYKAKMKQFIGAQMEILDNPAFSLEFHIEGEEEKEQEEIEAKG